MAPNLPFRNLLKALNFYTENENLKKEAEKLLGRFDIGFSELQIEEKEFKDGPVLQPYAVHEVHGTKYLLNLAYESSGTKQMLVLLKNILTALKHGGNVVIDEFDVNLHPEMTRELLDLFIQSETNPHNAQILFSTHTHTTLNELDKYQIILVGKNKNSVSEAWRLDEMPGVRSDDNYFGKYLAGAYGGVPNL